MHGYALDIDIQERYISVQIYRHNAHIRLALNNWRSRSAFQKKNWNIKIPNPGVDICSNQMKIIPDNIQNQYHHFSSSRNYFRNSHTIPHEREYAESASSNRYRFSIWEYSRSNASRITCAAIPAIICSLTTHRPRRPSDPRYINNFYIKHINSVLRNLNYYF